MKHPVRLFAVVHKSWSRNPLWKTEKPAKTNQIAKAFFPEKKKKRKKEREKKEKPPVKAFLPGVWKNQEAVFSLFLLWKICCF